MLREPREQVVGPVDQRRDRRHGADPDDVASHLERVEPAAMQEQRPRRTEPASCDLRQQDRASTEDHHVAFLAEKLGRVVWGRRNERLGRHVRDSAVHRRSRQT